MGQEAFAASQRRLLVQINKMPAIHSPKLFFDPLPKSTHHLKKNNKNRSYTEIRSVFRNPPPPIKEETLQINPNPLVTHQRFRTKLHGVRPEHVPLRERANKKVLLYEVEGKQNSFERTNTHLRMESEEKTNRQKMPPSECSIEPQMKKQKQVGEILQELNKFDKEQEQNQFLITLSTLRLVIQRRGDHQYRQELRQLQLRYLSKDEKCKMLQFVIKQFQKNNTQAIKDFSKKLQAFDFHWEEKMASSLAAKDKAVAQRIQSLEYENSQYKLRVVQLEQEVIKSQEIRNYLEKKKEGINTKEVDGLLESNYELTQSNKKLSAQLQRCQQGKNQVTSQLASEQHQTRQLKNKIAQLREQNLALKNCNQEQQHQLSELRQQRQTHLSNINALEARVIELATDLDSKLFFQDAFHAKQKELSDLASKQHRLEMRLQSLTKEINRQVYESDKDQHQNDELAAKLREIDQNLQIHMNTIFRKLNNGLSNLSKEEAITLINEKVEFINYLNEEKVACMTENNTRLKSHIILLNKEVKLLNQHIQCYYNRLKQAAFLKQSFKAMEKRQDNFLQGLRTETNRQIKKREKFSSDCQFCEQLLNRQSEWLEEMAALHCQQRKKMEAALDTLVKADQPLLSQRDY